MRRWEGPHHHLGVIPKPISARDTKPLSQRISRGRVLNPSIDSIGQIDSTTLFAGPIDLSRDQWNLFPSFWYPHHSVKITGQAIQAIRKQTQAVPEVTDIDQSAPE